MFASTLSSWRLSPPPCVGLLQMKIAAVVRGPALCFTVKSMAERSSARSSACRCQVNAAAPLLLGQAERRAQDVQQLALVGRHFGLGAVLEALPDIAEVHAARPHFRNRRRPAEAKAQSCGKRGDEAPSARRSQPLPSSSVSYVLERRRFCACSSRRRVESPPNSSKNCGPKYGCIGSAAIARFRPAPGVWR